jgi:hypothetical protein
VVDRGWSLALTYLGDQHTSASSAHSKTSKAHASARPAAPQCGLHGMREPLNLLLRLRTFATHAAPPGAAVWRSPFWFVAQQSICVCVTSCLSCHGRSQVARVRRLYENLLPDQTVRPRLARLPCGEVSRRHVFELAARAAGVQGRAARRAHMQVCAVRRLPGAGPPGLRPCATPPSAAGEASVAGSSGPALARRCALATCSTTWSCTDTPAGARRAPVRPGSWRRACRSAGAARRARGRSPSPSPASGFPTLPCARAPHTAVRAGSPHRLPRARRFFELVYRSTLVHGAEALCKDFCLVRAACAHPTPRLGTRALARLCVQAGQQ